MFIGAKVYNEISLEFNKIENSNEFEKQLKEQPILPQTEKFNQQLLTEIV